MVSNQNSTNSKTSSKANNSTRVRRVLVLAATARHNSRRTPQTKTAKPCQEGKNTHPLLLPSLSLSLCSRQSQTKPDQDQPTHWTGPCPAWSSAGPALPAGSLPRSAALELDGTESRGTGEKGRENSSPPRRAKNPTGGRQGGVERAAERWGRPCAGSSIPSSPITYTPRNEAVADCQLLPRPRALTSDNHGD